MSKSKLKIAFYWAASCGGCEIAVLDLNEKILDVAQLADIVFWPVAMDIKYKDVEAMPDNHIDIHSSTDPYATANRNTWLSCSAKNLRSLSLLGHAPTKAVYQA